MVGAAVKARNRPVVSGMEELLGATGEVIEDFSGKGRIRIHGEVWWAETAVPLQGGDKVRVDSIEGLVLRVHPAQGEMQ